ncbi:hypothetical protein [Streptomyces sp. NPDC046821]|uniref:hypothetical protein n=1 Tax=Streptomyces sp. NPDC046821 TaxID=3154702 RepID=UPI0033DEC050
MAVLIEAELNGVTTEQYDALNAKLQKAPGNPFAGCLAHVAVPTGSGLKIYDLWESEAAVQKFQDVVMPLAAEMGMSGGSMPQASKVHHYWVPGA